MIVWGQESPFQRLQTQLDSERSAEAITADREIATERAESFRMTGLFGLIPKSTTEPIRIKIRA